MLAMSFSKNTADSLLDSATKEVGNSFMRMLHFLFSHSVTHKSKTNSYIFNFTSDSFSVKVSYRKLILNQEVNTKKM